MQQPFFVQVINIAKSIQNVQQLLKNKIKYKKNMCIHIVYGICEMKQFIKLYPGKMNNFP